MVCMKRWMVINWIYDIFWYLLWNTWSTALILDCSKCCKLTNLQYTKYFECNWTEHMICVTQAWTNVVVHSSLKFRRLFPCTWLDPAISPHNTHKMAVTITLSKYALIAQNTTNKAVNNCHGHNAAHFSIGSMLDKMIIPCWLSCTKTRRLSKQITDKNICKFLSNDKHCTDKQMYFKTSSLVTILSYYP